MHGGSFVLGLVWARSMASAQAKTLQACMCSFRIEGGAKKCPDKSRAGSICGTAGHGGWKGEAALLRTKGRAASKTMKQTIYLAGGCFWGLEKYFEEVPGVLATQVGYANANIRSPSYQQVCTGLTNAAETVRVTYDDAQIPFEDILQLFLDAIDPTSVNRQGNDVGTQYRTGIYLEDPAQTEKARTFVAAKQGQYSAPIATEVEMLDSFYPAEEYHQKYLDKHPGGYCHIGEEEFEHARNYKISKTR